MFAKVVNMLYVLFDLMFEAFKKVFWTTVAGVLVMFLILGMLAILVYAALN